MGCSSELLKFLYWIFCEEANYYNLSYSRRQYKVSVPLKKNRCPTAYQRLKKRNHLPLLRRLYAHNFYAPFSV